MERDMYWLINPDHGVMPVYSMDEVERIKKFGWEVLNEGNSPDYSKLKPEKVVCEVVKPKPIAPRKKPGPKPKVK